MTMNKAQKKPIPTAIEIGDNEKYLQDNYSNINLKNQKVQEAK